MTSEVVVALFAGLGTLIGTFGGIITSNKLTNHRIQELEKKVDKHNSGMEKIAVIQEQIKVVNHRIEDLEEARK